MKFFFANRGMFMEELINRTISFNNDKRLWWVEKRQLRIQIITKNGPSITGRIQAKSTTDYFGVYKSKYLDFEVKQTDQKRLLFSAFKDYQLNHLKLVKEMGGISFVIIGFTNPTDTSFWLIEINQLIEHFNIIKHLTPIYCKAIGYELYFIVPGILDLMKTIDKFLI